MPLKRTCMEVAMRGVATTNSRPEAVLTRREAAHRLRRWLRSCGHCGSFLPPIETFCEACWWQLGLIQNRGGGIAQEGWPFPVFSLFTWNVRNAALVGALVRALKGGREVSAVARLAERLSFERQFIGGSESPAGLVLPPRRKAQFDHAWLWGQSLAKLWGCPVYDLLEPAEEGVGDIAQKSLTASARQQRRFRLKASAEPFRAPGRVVFVDDVVTSGATAMAVYMALADPVAFEVWAIADRPKLAVNSRS